jgi:YbbR domain-containing protein
VINFLRRNVFNNIGLKLVSLLAAALLWLAVTRSPVTEVAVKVPIEFQHVPTGLDLSSEHIPELQIRVRGPERLVHGLDQGEVHAIIDLAGVGPGERTYDLTGRQISVPHGVDVVQIIPAEFRISFDHHVARQVEIKPRVIGTFATGVHLTDVVPDPAMVTIAGPEKHVNAIDSAITDPVDATGVVGSATFTTHVYVSDPLVRVLRPDPVHVTVLTENTQDHKAAPGAH